MLYFFLLVLLVALSSIVHHKARGGAGIMIIKVKVEAGRGGNNDYKGKRSRWERELS
jgi:hypothetical protein